MRNTFLLILIAIPLLLSAKAVRFRCMWRTDPTTTMVVGWDQVSGTDPVLYYGLVDYGKNIDNYSFKQTPDKIVKFKGMNNHFVRLEDLEPNSNYFFVIKDSEGVSQRYFFQTAPINQRLSIIAGGDSRNHRKARRNANLLVSKFRPNVVLFGGDMTGGDTDREWIEWFDDWQTIISKDGRITPIVATRGNHEYSNRTIIELFDVPSKDVTYALQFGDLLKVFTLNTMIASGGSQKEWLESELKSASNVKYKIAQYHFTIRPHTAKKSERNDQLFNWSTLFYKYGLDLAVESDAHVVKSTYPIVPSNKKGSSEGFIRDDAHGTVYVGEGCWGAPLRKNNDDKPWTRASGSFNQFKLIFVSNSGMEIRTIQTDNAEQVGSVTPPNIFSLPLKTKVWSPKSGPVIYIGKDSPIVAAKAHKKKAMKIAHFVVKQDKLKMLVEWETKNEPEGYAFEIQKSIQGLPFKTIKKIEGEGGEGDYLFTDNAFKTKLPSKLNYRLKGVSSSGKVKIFPTFEVGNEKEAAGLEKIGVDDAGKILVKYKVTSGGMVKWKLFNASKKMIFHYELKNQKPKVYSKRMDLSKFPSGTYILVISSNDKVLRKYRVIK